MDFSNAFETGPDENVRGPPSPPLQLPGSPEPSNEKNEKTPLRSSTPTEPMQGPPPSSTPEPTTPDTSPQRPPRTLALSNAQMAAKLLLLMHIPTQIAGSIVVELVQQRNRLLDAGSTGDVREIAGEQMGVALERCRSGFVWIENDMPGWLDRRRDDLRSLPDILTQIVNGEGLSPDPTQPSPTRAYIPREETPQQFQQPPQYQPRQQSPPCRHRHHHLRHMSGFSKLILAGLVLFCVPWLLALPFTILRWGFRLKVPLWMILAVVWLGGRKGFRRRRGMFSHYRIVE